MSDAMELWMRDREQKEVEFDRRIRSNGNANRNDVINLAIAAATFWTSNTKLNRRGNTVDIYFQVAFTGTSGTGANVDTIVIPAAHQIAGSGSRYFWGMDSATGNAVGLYLTSNSIRHVFNRNNGDTTYGHIAYVAVD